MTEQLEIPKGQRCGVYFGDGVDSNGDDVYYTCDKKPVVGLVDLGIGVWVCQYHFEHQNEITLGWWQTF